MRMTGGLPRVPWTMSTSRMHRYIPLVREFAARIVLFHGAVGESVGLNATDLKVLDRLYDAYGAEMAKILARYDAKEFALIEDFLTKTTDLLTEQTMALRERAKG